MPIFNSFAAEDQELTPTMTAEFDECPDVLNDAAEVCLPISQSGICNREKSTVRLTAESVDGSIRTFDSVDETLAGQCPRHDQNVPSLEGPNLIRCFQ